ncbi:MAG: TIGR00282 family metallophosphoesterase [Algisphaera sp.]
MRIAYLGDLVGTSGRQALTQQLPHLREQWGADVVIANCENVANGSGITPEQYKKLTAAGVDGITLGDHAFRKQQIKATLNETTRMIRPLNLPPKAWGHGAMVIAGAGKRPDVYVAIVLGRLFMNTLQGSDPFTALDRWLAGLPKDAVVLVELHAEATSEKVALGWYLNGRVAAVVGSHTHVPTADARVLPAPGSELSIPRHDGPVTAGTAYVTDLGMTGSRDSVLGRRVDRVVHHMSTGLPAAFDVAEGRPEVHGVVIDIDDTTRRATAIERVALSADISKPPFAMG